MRGQRTTLIPARRVLAALGSAVQWAVWFLCALLILPVLLNVPGRPEPGDLALYLSVLSAVLIYPVLLPMLAAAEWGARRRLAPHGLARMIHPMRWLACLTVMGVIAALALAFYAHERARPVPSQAELFSNAYANAILRHDTNWMDRLMADGASVDHPMDRGETPAIMSASFGDWTMVLFLLGRGADPDRRDDQGRTVRTWAASPRAPARKPEEVHALEQVRAVLRER